jgi:small-conductance mechanosensitive channel
MDVGRMRRVARPYFLRALVATLLALGGLILASQGAINRSATPTEKALAYSGATALLLFGVIAVRSFARGVRAAAGETLGDTRSGPLGLVISTTGYVIVTLTALSVLGINMSGLLLGGALTGVILGIAAQQTLGNFFAGLVLLFVRPFTLGDEVIFRSGPLGGEYEGVVTDMSLFYVSLQTAHGPVQLPNAGVLASAIGPGARGTSDDDEPPDDEGPMHGGTP